MKVQVLLKRLHLNVHTMGFHVQTHKLKLHTYWIAPCESTAEQFSYEWSHHRISHIDSEVKALSCLNIWLWEWKSCIIFLHSIPTCIWNMSWCIPYCTRDNTIMIIWLIYNLLFYIGWTKWRGDHFDYPSFAQGEV